MEFRAKLLKPRAVRLELHNTFWELSDEWVEPDGTPLDLMYRSCDAIEADVEARLGRGLASLGYSTSLCHSVLQATPVFDRRGWLQALLDRVKSTPYPNRLVEGVIKLNLPGAGKHYPFLRTADSLGFPSAGSSQHQPPHRGLAGQLLRHSVCRQLAPQPGEKRLLVHAQALPPRPKAWSPMWRSPAREPAA